MTQTPTDPPVPPPARIERAQLELDFDDDAWPVEPAPRGTAPEAPHICESCT